MSCLLPFFFDWIPWKDPILDPRNPINMETTSDVKGFPHRGGSKKSCCQRQRPSLHLSPLFIISIIQVDRHLICQENLNNKTSFYWTPVRSLATLVTPSRTQWITLCRLVEFIDETLACEGCQLKTYWGCNFWRCWFWETSRFWRWNFIKICVRNCDRN